MTRNMDLVQEILSEVRATDHFSGEPEDLRLNRLPGHWDIQKVSYHVVLLLEEGFLARGLLPDGNNGTHGNGTYSNGTHGNGTHGSGAHGNDTHGNGTLEHELDSSVGLRLTWRGHDLLEELSEEAVQF